LQIYCNVFNVKLKNNFWCIQYVWRLCKTCQGVCKELKC
jgi:hypothetical protein